MRVALVGFDDFTDIDYFLAWDLLSRVPGMTVQRVASTPTIVSSTGIRVEAQAGLEACATADGVYISSGRGSRQRVKDAAWMEALVLAPERQWIAAVDSGALILAAKGLLRGKRATTYPSDDLHEALARFGATVVDEALVVEGRLATAAQCLAGVDLVRWFVANLGGEAVAEDVIASVRRRGDGA